MTIATSRILQRSIWRIKGTLPQMVGTVCFYFSYLIGKPVSDGVWGGIFLKKAISFDETRTWGLFSFSMCIPATTKQCKVYVGKNELW